MATEKSADLIVQRKEKSMHCGKAATIPIPKYPDQRHHRQRSPMLTGDFARGRARDDVGKISTGR